MSQRSRLLNEVKIACHPIAYVQFLAYFAVKITTLQQHETLMGTWLIYPVAEPVAGEDAPHPSGHVFGKADTLSPSALPSVPKLRHPTWQASPEMKISGG